MGQRTKGHSAWDRKGKKGRHTMQERGGKVETGRDTVPKDRRPQGQKEEEEEERTVPPHQKVL